jgi:tRNA modification GTPase
MISQDDTIAAIATPIGTGGISVIRVSGLNAIDKVSTIFQGKRPLISEKTHTAHYGKIIDGEGNSIDEVLVTIFRAPHSYTSEDMVEISCHGGIYVTQMVLEKVLSANIRSAQPGEFTKRAFINGRIDLAQAEAVTELIQASSKIYHQSAIAQLEGKVSNDVNKIRDKLLKMCSLLELELDFIEEGFEFNSKEQVKFELETLYSIIQKSIVSFEVNKRHKNGIRVVIVGKPNVGKSSIFNILLNKNRSIVTEIPGTTRDIIEEKIVINDVLFRITDSAGIRNSSDKIEIEGMNRTQYQIGISEIVLFVVDPTQGVTKEDDEIFNAISDLSKDIMPHVITVVNKVDIFGSNHAFNTYNWRYFSEPICISTKKNFGLMNLRALLLTIGTNQQLDRGSIGVISERHKVCLERANTNIKKAITSLLHNISYEFIAFDVRTAIGCLSEVIGEIKTNDILDNIFSRFCIGK